jgi:hypothetical protein
MTISKAWATVYLTAFAAIGGCDPGDEDLGHQGHDWNQERGRKGRETFEPTPIPSPAPATKAAAEDNAADKVVRADAKWPVFGGRQERRTIV